MRTLGRGKIDLVSAHVLILLHGYEIDLPASVFILNDTSGT